MDNREDSSATEGMLVDGKRFLVFAAIESDPDASSVGWLQARLAELAEGVRCGRRLSVYEPAARRLVPVSSIAELSAWARRHFPIADFDP